MRKYSKNILRVIITLLIQTKHYLVPNTLCNVLPDFSNYNTNVDIVPYIVLRAFHSNNAALTCLYSTQKCQRTFY